MEEISTYLLLLIDQIEEKLVGIREEDVFYSNYGLNFQEIFKRGMLHCIYGTIYWTDEINHVTRSSTWI